MATQPDNVEEIEKAQNGFFYKLSTLAGSRFHRLKNTIMTDFSYQPQNSFTLTQKKKIFHYLEIKYLMTVQEMEEFQKKKFTQYDPNTGKNVSFKDLMHVKQIISRINTTVEAAEDRRKQLLIAEKQIKAKFFDQISYEFDKQRYTSMGWGLLVGALICGSIYKKGSITRKCALFLTSGHIFYQLSYYYNIDKYFDSIYKIFQEDAISFTKQQLMQDQLHQKKKIKGRSYVED